MSKYMWKFLNKSGRSIISANGDQKWKIGEWVTIDGDLEICHNGLHASSKIYEAFSYVQGDVLAKVEVKGKHVDEVDKSAYQSMRIVEAYKWQKKDSVALAIYSAELRLKEFEKLYPDDKRPREAIEAARAVLAHDTKKNRDAAWSAASAASAARSAWSAASAARSAWSAAESAAASAAESAAASAAASAAESAAASATIKKIDKWLADHVNELEKIK